MALSQCGEGITARASDRPLRYATHLSTPVRLRSPPSRGRQSYVRSSGHYWCGTAAARLSAFAGTAIPSGYGRLVIGCQPTRDKGFRGWRTASINFAGRSAVYRLDIRSFLHYQQPRLQSPVICIASLLIEAVSDVAKRNEYSHSPAI